MIEVTSDKISSPTREWGMWPVLTVESVIREIWGEAILNFGFLKKKKIWFFLDNKEKDMAFPTFMLIAVNNIIGICELNLSTKGHLVLSDGIEAEFLEILSKTLKFQYKLIVPEDKQWGAKQPNGSWTGMIGMVNRGEADMTMCSPAISEERKSVVFFTSPYEIEQIVFATKAPGFLPKYFAYLYPFSSKVWLAVIVLILTIPFLWKVLLKYKMRLTKLWSNVFISFLNGGTNINPVMPSEYVLLGTWIPMVPFLTYSYTAVLLSFLTLPLQETVVRDVPELAQAISNGKYRCMVYEGTGIKDLLKGSPTTSVQLIGKAVENYKWFINPTLEDVGKALSEKNVAVVSTRSFFEDHFFGRAVISYDYFHLAYFGLVLNKHFCCKKSLELALSRIQASGLFQKVKMHHQFRAHLKFRKYQTESLANINPLSIEDLSGALLMWLLGISSSIFAFLLELLLRKDTAI
ncbi:Glutamate receptor ionotropic, kainate 4 [Araneus ventricosus]|uniref:Glutamate receptor ionotropic, kainate 4 n=1 Tax=Araneus ventricosus TaxID=182803 RepID=A0A4Y2I2U4_ARAVE|nr:Glutamate receptor ionotropic, kainate 4 [Araneus ventricosus]